jgi:hypothetical protein
VSFEGEGWPGVFLLGFRARLFIVEWGFMAMWKKVAIVVVAWIASVLIYVEFFTAR